MSFETTPLAPATRAALSSMGITEPTPIQARSLPILFAGRDLIGQARTGSGKTLAFALPMVEKVDAAVKAVQALVLVPTRELAQQVADVVDRLVDRRPISCVRIFGGKALGPQIAALRRGPQIVVGTPGRVLDLLRQEALHLDRLIYLVLDEADEMLDRGFAQDVERILAFAPRERQTVLLSATVPEWVQGTAQKYLRNPELVRVDPQPEDAPKIDHVIYDVPEGQKLPVLRSLLDERDSSSVLVFGRTKHGVKKLAKQLIALGYPAAALQGNLSQNARDVVMADFRAGNVPILLATNVAARGLDVDHIGLVINYELPETGELLTHRVGRTGRMGREGDAVTLLAPSDELKWRQLAKTLKVRIPRRPWKGELTPTPAAVDAIPLYPRPEKPQPGPAMQRPAASPVLPAPRASLGNVGADHRAQPRPNAASVRPISGQGARTDPGPRAGQVSRHAAPQARTGRASGNSPYGSHDRPSNRHQPATDRFGRPLAREKSGSFYQTLQRLEDEEASANQRVPRPEPTNTAPAGGQDVSATAGLLPPRRRRNRSRRDGSANQQRRSA